jgi:hypothetical protein
MQMVRHVRWSLWIVAGLALFVLSAHDSWSYWLGVGLIAGVTWLAIPSVAPVARSTFGGKWLEVGAIAAFLAFGVSLFVEQAFGFSGLAALCVFVAER